MTINLLDLPHEVLHNILVNTNPDDLGRLCCCRTLHVFIRNDKLLDKELYFSHYDNAAQHAHDPEPEWTSSLRKLVHAQKILESKDTIVKTANVEKVAEFVEHLLSTAAKDAESSRNIALLAKLFESEVNREIFLCGSFLFDWGRNEAWDAVAATRLQREIASGFDFTEPTDTSDSSDMEADTDFTAVTSDPDDTSPTLGDSVEGAPIPPELKTPRSEIKFSRQTSGSPEPLTRKLSAKLHCLFGVSIDTVRNESISSFRYSLRSATTPIHPYARSRVYDLRQHTDSTYWGPFLDDGSYSVDWEKMEALMITLDHNMRLSSRDHHEFQGMIEVQEKPFMGAVPHSFITPPCSIPMQPALPLELQDPYNITGTWNRVVCFLDYRELYAFNFGDDQDMAADEPRRPIDTQEAIRLITMKVRVTKIEPLGEEDGQKLPVVHFRGTSSATRPHWDPNANSTIKGTVRLTHEGEVRWTTFSVYHGEERWRSEGIQIGGVQSARGVLGFWFDKDRDPHGPAGPTAFWKAHDGIEETRATPTTSHGVQLFTVPMY